MPNGWVPKRLADVVTLQRGFDLPAQARRPGHVPILGSFGVTGSHDEARVRGPGVTIGRSGASIGVATYSAVDFWPLNTALYVKDFHGNDPMWVYWLLHLIDFTAYNSGSAQPSLNRNFLAQIPVNPPTVEEQREISGVLGALDDLIDANRAEAVRLDALCGAMGREFLTSLDDRPTARLDEVASIRKGYSYKSLELVAGGNWLVNLKNVGRHGRYQPRGLKPLTGNHKPVHVVENGDICVAQTDLTQNREVIGRPIRVRRGSVTGDLVASLDLVIVQPGPRTTCEYLYAVVDSAEFRSHALGFCNGTTVVHMASAAVPSFEAPVPSHDDLCRFSERVRVLRGAADEALIDAERVERARDELLPLLLSGRVRVGEVAA